MKIKNKILTGLATIVFSLYPYHLQAVPADPNNLPKGWKQVTQKRESQRKIKVKVNNETYLETLITTENLIEFERKRRKPFVWATTNLEGKVISNITVCRKADFTATIAYLNESCDLKKITKKLGKTYKNASKLTFGYDVLENTLKKIIEIEGRILRHQLTGSTDTFTDLFKREVTQEAKNYINKIKETLTEKIREKGLKGIKEIKDEIKEIIENSVYYKLDSAGKTLEEASEVLEENRRIWSYEDAAKFYPKFKRAWTDASSTLTFWYTLKDYTAKDIAKEIANVLSKGITGKSLKDLIGISLNKDRKLQRALRAMKEKRKSKLKFFRKNIERMFDYNKGGDAYLFLHSKK